MPSSLFGQSQIPQTQMQQPVAAPQNIQVNPQLQSMIQLFKSGGNPSNMIQSMISAKNPQMAQVMQIVSSSGGDAKAAFYKLAAQKGVDPNAILSMLR